MLFFMKNKKNKPDCDLKFRIFRQTINEEYIILENMMMKLYIYNVKEIII